MEPSLEVVRAVQLGFLIPTNLVGNGLVVWVVLRTRKTLRTPMNYMVMNLAVADMVVAFFMVTDQFFFHVAPHPEGAAGDLLCKTLTGKIFSWMGAVASVCTLLVIAYERFHVIVRANPARAQLTNTRLHLIMTSCWAFAFVFNIPLVLVRKHNKSHAETGFFCKSNWPSKNWAIAYSYMWVFVVGVIPLGLMLALYGGVVHNLWFNQKHVTDEAQKARLKNRKRVTKTLIILTFLFPLCWFPNLLINTISYYANDRDLLSTGYLASELLVLLNSTVNPFLYAIHSKQFRKAIKNIVYCYPRRPSGVAPLGTGARATAATIPANRCHMTNYVALTLKPLTPRVKPRIVQHD